MSITAGTRLGPYEIIRPIGAGGMGEVFLARDTRLERVVAIKVLPEAFARDESRRSRLQREARIISQLNHPHICTLYDTGSEDGADYLVMEYVEGHSLADRLTKGALPFDEGLRAGIEIAEALHAAHQNQIVHRDLKPGNVMLTKSGVKLLDFGLAKFGGSTDVSVTADRAVIGTPRYMAPEQIDGHRSDHRADIFSLGCVLYEMRIGKPAMGGMQRVKPPELDHVIAKCLERDPERRWQSTADIAEQLRWIAGHRNPWKPVVWIAASLLTLILLGSLAVLQFRRRDTRPLRATFSRLTDLTGIEQAPALSPDGKLVAYESRAAGNSDIYLLRIGGRNPVNLTADSKAEEGMPAFSPDGQLIAFRSERDGGGIFVMGATGESVRRVSDFGFNPAWSPDGKELAISTEPMGSNPYAFRVTADIWRIEVATGHKRRVFQMDAFNPSWSPRGDRIAFCRSRGREISTIPSNGGRPSVVVSGSRDWNPVWSADGHIYFSSDRGGSMNLWRVAVDDGTGQPRSEPEPLTTPALWSGPLSVSGNGKRIVYCAFDRQSSLQRMAFDPAREMVVGPAVEVPLGKMYVANPDLSPDGQWIAFHTMFEPEDVYIVRNDGSELRRLTEGHSTNTWPRWSPDGKRVAFASNRKGVTSRPGTPFQIWAINADGGGVEQLTDLNGAGGPPLWSPDARRLVISSPACKTRRCFVDLFRTLPARTAEPVPPFREGFQIAPRAWSPDGKWLVGMTFPRDRLGDGQAFVYSVETHQYQLLPSLLGFMARWMSDSRRILDLHDNKLYVADRATGSAREIYAFPFTAIELVLSSDNRTIYFLRTSEEADIWLAELQ